MEAGELSALAELVHQELQANGKEAAVQLLFRYSPMHLIGCGNFIDEHWKLGLSMFEFELGEAIERFKHPHLNSDR